mgnify:CR=1 FL=1
MVMQLQNLYNPEFDDIITIYLKIQIQSTKCLLLDIDKIEEITNITNVVSNIVKNKIK